MGFPIGLFELMGKDGEALQSFYSKVMGWKISTDNPMRYGVVDTDSGGAGGESTLPPTVVPDMVTFAQFADPAGNIVGLVKSQS